MKLDGPISRIWFLNDKKKGFMNYKTINPKHREH